MSTFYDYLIEDIDEVKDAVATDKSDEEKALDALEFAEDAVTFDSIKAVVQKATSVPDWDSSKYLKKLKDIVTEIKTTRGFSSISWWKRVQYFYNAYLAETAIKNACTANGVTFGDNTHTDLQVGRKAENNPDLKFIDKEGNQKTLEVKIFANKSSIANYSEKSFHDADYVVIYVLANNTIIFKKRNEKGKYKEVNTIENSNIAETIKNATQNIFYEFIRLTPDNEKIEDYKFIKITPLKTKSKEN